MPKSLMTHSLPLPLLDETATEVFGRTLATHLHPGNILFLEGDLGAGKTTCVRGILRGFGFSDPVKSPTYTLVEEYEFNWGMLYHFDLYRIKDAAELEFIGIRDYINDKAIVLVEWAERGTGALPKPDLELVFSIPAILKFQGMSKKAENLENLENPENPEKQATPKYPKKDQAQRIVTMKADSEKGQHLLENTLQSLKKDGYFS